ncbi:hypothetical protein [Bradyrhizobium sp. 23AC]
MTTSDLNEILERIALAREKIEHLSAAERDFFSKAMEADCVVNGETYAVRVMQKTPTPVAIRQEVGLIVHELRSCLDAIACQLAIRNRNSPDDVYFPISKSEEIFKSDGMKKIKKLSADDQQIIIDLAPHREANRVLFGLHDFDRKRKHQRLGTLAWNNKFSVGGAVFGAIGGAKINITDSLVNGHAVRALSIGSQSAKALVENVGQWIHIAQGKGQPPPLAVQFNLAYIDSDLGNEPVIKTLNTFANSVENIARKFV